MIAEFTVLPKYRRHHVAQRAIELVFEQYPGKWELKYSTKDSGATAFWAKVTERFAPTVHQLEGGEEGLGFCSFRPG